MSETPDLESLRALAEKAGGSEIFQRIVKNVHGLAEDEMFALQLLDRLP